MSTITLKTGEAKTIRFTIIDSDDDVVDVSAATLSFAVKKRKGDSLPVIFKTDGDFGKTQAVNGIVDLPISSFDTTLPAAKYIGELKAVFTASNIDKSADITFVIEQAVD